MKLMPAAGTAVYAIVLFLLVAAARLYEDGPPPAHTGGFGEPTCAACHFDAPINPPGGQIDLHVPDQYEAGAEYEISIRLQDEQLVSGGFQLSARFGDGAQAGKLAPLDARTTVTSGQGAVLYAQHNASSVTPVDGEATWTLLWTAPAVPAGKVHFHVAANSANGDVSEFGDRLFTAEARTCAFDSTRYLSGSPPDVRRSKSRVVTRTERC